LKAKADWIERAKRNAAREAVKLVEDGFIVGLGSGSTTAYAIEEIGKKMKQESLHILAIPTSYQAFSLAAKHRIPLTTLEEHTMLDLTIDGADQIDGQLNLIKGMGGALAREKIVASASNKLVIIADESKRVRTLGENNHPIPIEVLPFATAFVLRRIGKSGGRPVLREGKGKVGPVVTDNGNVIIDVVFGLLYKPEKLEHELRDMPGVVETGLFIGMADVAYIGMRSGVEKLVGKP